MISSVKVSLPVKRPKMTGFSAALFFLLKFFYCWSKYFALFHPNMVIPLLLLGDAANCWVPVLWNEISLAFEATIFEAARSELQNPDCSDTAKEEALKANRKSSSLSDVYRLLLELCLDQFTASFFVFTKVGCGQLAACGAAIAILLLPTFVQLAPQSRIRIREFSTSKRNRESDM